MFDKLPRRRRSETLVSRVGAAIRNARQFVGLSQIELAARAGISRRTLTSIESGTGDVLLSTIERIAPHLDLYPSDLLAFAEDEAEEGVA